MGRSLGKYELLTRLASGGMGQIYLARLAGDGGFEKVVVLKRLLPELVSSEKFVSMFLHEARIAARLSHMNICDVYELGQDGNEYFIVMPYLQGVPMSTLMQADAARDRLAHVRLMAGLMQQACAGLHHAHELRDDDDREAGIVHRDVTPNNLFVTVDGVLKVLDFGIAKARGSATRTDKGTVKGTSAYMAPEQLRGDTVDRRADVFALAIVLHEAVTGRRLFRRDTDYLTARAILEDDYPAAASVDDAVPEALSQVIARALSRDRARRFATAQDFGAAIAEAVLPVGGVMPPSEIAAHVTAGFAPALEARRRQYRDAVRGDAQPAEEGDAFARHTASFVPPPASPEPEPSRIAKPGAGTAVTRRARPARDEVSGTRTTVHEPSTAPTLPRRAWIVFPVAVVVAAAVVLVVRGGGSRAGDDAVAGPAVVVDARTAGAMSRAIAAAPTEAASRQDAGSAAAPDPVAAPDAAPASAPPSAARRPARRGPPGFVSVDSSPYATVYMDGRRLGITPLIRHRAPAGLRRFRAVLSDGRSQRFSMRVRAGKLAKPRRLSW